MIKHAVMIIVAIIIWLIIIVLKQHREKVLLGGIFAMVLINGVYSYTHAGAILPSRDSKLQTLYHTDYLKTDEFPDAFLRLFLRDKRVYIKNDVVSLHEAEDAGYEWIYSYYHVKNMRNYLNSIGSIVIDDEEMNEKFVSTDQANEFEKLGYLNDLLRNSLMYSNDTDDVGNFLFYLNYYRDVSDTAYIYANVESLSEEELVILWQPRSEDNVETEDMYMMGRKYYEDKIAR